MAGELTPREDAWRSLFHSFQPAPPQMALAAAPKAQKAFSFFGGDDLAAASALAAEFDRIAGPLTPADPAALAAVMLRFHEVAGADKTLAQWALRLFIAGRPGADILPMPTLRQQLAVHFRERKAEFAALVDLRALAAAPAAGSEDLIAYYRHDLDLSDHHLHWHSLYPFARPRKGLQGRLFLFMHQQMLARYNTERFATGLPLVEPFLEWDDQASWNTAFKQTTLPADPIAPWIGPAWMKSGANYIGFDEKGSSPAANDPADLDVVLKGLNHVVTNLKAGAYKTDDTLGMDLEASSRNPALAAGPHNMGHVVLSAPPGMPAQPPQDQPYFVMYSPEVAMTTPIFYRWHRVIDDISFAWQQAQGPDRLAYTIPPLKIRRGPAATPTRSPDVIISPRSAIAGIDGPAFDLQTWAGQTFGGPGFDADAPAALNVDELVTQLNDDPAIGGLQVLSLKTDWVYCLRLQNPTGTDSNVTIRIWLAALSLSPDRRNWIEMDKFVATVPANASKVVARGSWQSVVVRAKSVTDPMMLADTSDSYDDTGDDHRAMWCECGLPYRLLLPRGTAAGMPARFLVLLTDATEDQTLGQGPDCGSVTFCAKQNDVWPDSKPMGFPFHRPFAAAQDPVLAHFDPMPNAAWRDISIRAT